MLNVHSDRECFFDEYLIDIEKTTAEFRIHQPVLQGPVMKLCDPWEGDSAGYFNMFFDNGVYRMYYKGCSSFTEDRTALAENDNQICYAESVDGIHWTKPSLNICEWEGSKDNNIIIIPGSRGFDGFMVFRDDNPCCLPEQRYKGIAKDRYFINDDPNNFIDELYCWYSPDAIHFTRGPIITTEGKFDSLNVAFWDPESKLYRLYIRGFHGVPDGVIDAGVEMGTGTRDIRYLESKDFLNWSHPVMLEYGDDVEDCQLYTNCVMPYCRAPQMMIGFPTRYVERPDWNGNYEELCGKEERLFRMKFEPRLGMAFTDCLFMVSHDGKTFKRYDEAFIRPGSENGFNWIYGDAYPARGFAETPSKTPGADPELSMYMGTKQGFSNGELNRYTIRMDGFVSLHAGSKEAVITTKPFAYTGSELFINFATSARGYLKLSLVAKDGTVFRSVETFGDSIDRRVAFEQEDAVKALSGEEVVLKIEMLDADIYAIQFR